MKKTMLFILIFMVLGIACGNEMDEYVLPEKPTRQSIIDMAIKYNAIAKWGNYEGRDFGETYTIQLQRAVKNTDAPYLMFVMITDIVEYNNKLFFLCFFTPDYETETFVLLESALSEEKLNTILQMPKDDVMLYAVIAQINDIEKPPLSIYGEPDEFEDFIDVELLLDFTTALIIKGSCLDFTKSGYLSADEKNQIIEEIKSLQTGSPND